MTLITYVTRVHFADGVLEEALWSEVEVNRKTRPLIVTDETHLDSELYERLLAGLPVRTSVEVVSDVPVVTSRSKMHATSAKANEPASMSVNGVVIGLMVTDLPFSFTALLGLLSLSGMLIKNGIVLVEEIDLVRAEGLPLRDAIVTASVSRLRPVLLAAITTILGMVPLLADAFFVSMAVTIMGGLAFATVLTLVAAPVFYLIFFKRAEARELSENTAAV